jgi:hemolysin activation/secretion protein
MIFEITIVTMFISLLVLLTGFPIVYCIRWFKRPARLTSIITARGNRVKSLGRQVTFAVALLALSQSAFAIGEHSAGGQFQQIPPSPTIQKEPPKIVIEQDKPPTIPDSYQARILVKSLRVTGQTLYSEAELIAVTGFTPGRELTLSDLRGMAGKIADHYHKNGYFAAQAYLPVQDIKDGVVVIAVIEGRYGNIKLNNTANLSNYVVNNLFKGLNRGDIIAIAPLERRLLLLSDLPGVEVVSTLVPGSTAGESDLIVDIKPGARFNGSVDADNAGNRYTGEYRIGTTLYFNEPIGYGDAVTLRALTSGFGLFYVRAAYEAQLGQTRGGIAYSYLQYELIKEFKPLDANGTAHIASIYDVYPLIRSRNNNLYAGITFDYRVYQDRVDATSTVVDRQSQVLMPTLYGDHRDNFFGGGLSSFSLTWFAGNLDIRTQAARNIDSATARTNGLYNKVRFNAMRLQNVTESFSIYASFNGQLAFNNLDISEKMELGGMYAVRAYPEGEAYADEGYVATLEGRLKLPKFFERLPGQMQLVGFGDIGGVRVNHSPGAWATGSNNRTLYGAGLGLTWMDYNNFSVKAYYAYRLGSEKVLSGPNSPGQFWIQLVKYF